MHQKFPFPRFIVSTITHFSESERELEKKRDGVDMDKGEKES